MRGGTGALNKSDRVLILFYRLIMGERIKKPLFMEEFSVGRRSFDRYIEAVRVMLSETFAPHELCYDPTGNEYYLTGLKQAQLRGVHALPLVLLLFESHALGTDDIAEILQKLIPVLPVEERHILREAIKRIGKGYGDPVSSNSLLKLIWDLNFVIDHCQWIYLWYEENAVEQKTDALFPVRLSYADDNLVLTLQSERGNPATEISYLLRKIRSFELANEQILM